MKNSLNNFNTRRKKLHISEILQISHISNQKIKIINTHTALNIARTNFSRKGRKVLDNFPLFAYYENDIARV
jgi:hypothetical protein